MLVYARNSCMNLYLLTPFNPPIILYDSTMIPILQMESRGILSTLIQVTQLASDRIQDKIQKNSRL